MRIRLFVACSAWACSLTPAMAQEQVRQLGLAEAVAIAMEKSPRMGVASADLHAARAESRAARANTLPQLGAHAYTARSTMPMIATSAPGVMPSNVQMLPDGRFTDFNLMLMAPLYTGGVLRGQAHAATAMARSMEAMRKEVAAEVELSVTDAYLSVLVAAELEAAEASRVTAMQETARVTQGRFEAGRDVEASVRRAEAELAEAQQMLVIARSDREKMMLELLSSMGEDLDLSLALTDRLAFNLPALDLQGYMAAARAHRGELLAAQAQVDQALALVSAARGAVGPQLYGFAMSDSFQSSRMGDDSGYSVGLVASLPVFDGGMRGAELERSHAMLRRAQAQRDDVALRVEREVRQAWIDVQAASENYSTAISAITAAEAAYEVARMRYESGRAILVEQLDSLSTLTRARANLARALYSHQIAVARTQRAAGVTSLTNQGEMQ